MTNYIQIDNRENDLLIYLKKIAPADIIIQISPMDIGDVSFIIQDKPIALIERKTLHDLSASIKDGRYEEQSYRLHGHSIPNHNISYLIEGDINKWNNSHNITKTTLISAMTSIQYVKGFSIIRTQHLEETAFYILHSFQKLVKSFKQGKQLYFSEENKNDVEEGSNYTSVIKNKKKENITPENMGSIILSQIPGISSVTAIAIMKHYSTLPILITALKENPHVLFNITYVNAKGQTRKINKSSGENIIQFLSIS